MHHPNHELIGLGIQQPWAELILQGIKSIEVRNVPVGMRKTIYLYSSRQVSKYPDADVAAKKYKIDTFNLPRGKIVGTVDVAGCRECEPSDSDESCVSWSLMENRYSWFLENPQRCQPLLDPTYLPYGMWFYPFKRQGKTDS